MMRVHVWTEGGHAGVIPHAQVVRLLWPTRDRTHNRDDRMNITERTVELNMRHVVAFLVEPEAEP